MTTFLAVGAQFSVPWLDKFVALGFLRRGSALFASFFDDKGQLRTLLCNHDLSYLMSVSRMTVPTVSVGISFYNNVDTLGDAIRSVLNQSSADWELILTNDGSKDGSLAVAQSFSDPRIRLLDDVVNRGLVARLNQQIALSRGRYFARMDADDLMHPDRLARQLAYLEAHPEDDLLDTNMYSLDKRGHVLAMRGRTCRPLALPEVLRGQTPFHATVMGRIVWFRRFPYDPEYIRAEDLELWARSVGASRFGHLEEALYFVREGKVNVNNYVRSQVASIKIYRRYGPINLGCANTSALCVRACLKALVYLAFGMLNAQHLLVVRRNSSLSPLEKSVAETALAWARAVSA